MKSYYLDHPFITLQIGSRNYMNLIRTHTDSDYLRSKYKVFESRTGDNEERVIFHTNSKWKLKIWMDLNQFGIYQTKIHRSDFGVKERLYVAHVVLKERS